MEGDIIYMYPLAVVECLYICLYTYLKEMGERNKMYLIDFRSLINWVACKPRHGVTRCLVDASQ